MKATIAVAAAAVIGCDVAPKSGTPAGAAKTKGDEAVTEEKATLPDSIRHGFRVDPMKYVEESVSLQAALVRKHVFGRARMGDEELIRAEIEKLLAEARPDGTLGETHNQKAGKLLELLSLGCPPDRREVALTLNSLEKADVGSDIDPRIVIEAFLVAGRLRGPSVRIALRDLAERTVAELGEGCPGTPYAQLRVLWLWRDAAEVDEEIERILGWLEDAIEPPGCSRTLGLCNIWGIFETLGLIDHPAASRIMVKLVPTILRAQGEDGGWKDCYGKDKSLWFFRALKRHGLLEQLRELPPLPPDWRIVRSVPAPGEAPRNIGFAHGHLWVLGGGAVTAISEEDGSVIKSVKLGRRPGRNHFALAAGDESFWLSAFADKKKDRPAAVVEFDAETGKVLRDIPLAVTNDPVGIAKVGSKLLVGDGWAGATWLVDLEKPDATPPVNRVAASMPDYMSGHGDDIWCVDWFSPSLVRTNIAGDLVDWGERPFGFEPVAYDGQNLWALDTEGKRICLIEKNAPDAPRVRRGAPELRDDLYELMNGLDKAQELEWGRVFGLNTEGRAEELAKLAKGRGFTQVVDDDGAVIWMNADGLVEAAFSYLPDAGDLGSFRDVYRRIERTDAPVTFVVFPQPGRKDTFDAHRLSRKSYLEHSWELGVKSEAEPLPLPGGVRRDLYDMFRTPADEPTSPLSKEERRHWGWRLSHSDAKVIAKLESDAARYDCTQSVDGGLIIWKDAGGKPAVAFRVVRDPRDPKAFRGLYDRLIRERIPLAYCFVNQLPDADGDWDVWSMSRRCAQSHCWRFWAREARPAPDEETGPAEETF